MEQGAFTWSGRTWLGENAEVEGLSTPVVALSFRVYFMDGTVYGYGMTGILTLHIMLSALLLYSRWL